MDCRKGRSQTLPLSVPGISLKSAHHQQILETKPNVAWFEVHPENLKSGMAFSYVERIRQDYPLSFHSVGLSLGSAVFNEAYLSFLKEMIDRLSPALFSGHVAWNYAEDVYIDDLLPLPYNDESLSVLVENIQKTQDALQRQILIENPSSYISFENASYTECEFVIKAAETSGCGILLDLNNVYVSHKNGGENPKEYIKKMIKSGLVGEIHLGGHEVFKMPSEEVVFLDTHSTRVASPVWDLFDYCLSLSSAPIPVLIEWDQKLPSLEMLLEEAEIGKKLMARYAAPKAVTASF